MSLLVVGSCMLVLAVGLFALRWKDAPPSDELNHFWRHEVDLVTYSLALCYMPFQIAVWNFLQHFGLHVTWFRVAVVILTAVIVWHLHQKDEYYKVDLEKARAARLLAPLRIANMFMYVGVLWEAYGLLQLTWSHAS